VLESLIQQFAGALTLRRIRAHAALVAIALWSVFIWDYSTPGLVDRNGLIKGTDFLHFYTIGTLAREGHFSDLYDIEVQTKLAAEVVPEAKGMVYLPLYGPQVALFFAPLTKLSYGVAFLAWIMLNAALYATCCWSIWRQCRALRGCPGTIALAALGLPAFFHLLVWGQTSGLALFALTLMFLALKDEHRFAAGLAFGLLFFKPQLGLAGFVIFLLAGEWKILGGAAITSSAQLSIAWLMSGTLTMREYLASLWQIPATMYLLEPKPYQLHSLRGFWELLVPWSPAQSALYGISFVCVLMLAFRAWQSTRSLELRFSALLVATVLAAPHLTIYDLVILAPIFLLLVEWSAASAISAAGLRVLLYLCFVLPLIGPLARWTHVQLTVVVMFALLMVVERMARETETSVQNARAVA
jgi:hypothetical protein